MRASVMKRSGCIMRACFIELSDGMHHPTTIHPGGLMLFAMRLIFSDLIGSGTTLVSMKSHLGHSKVRFSERSGRRLILARFIRMRHLTQRGRSIGESITSVSERGMSLT
jgi:hypothetical protein